MSRSKPPVKYCSQCGHEVELKTPRGDSLPRHVCTDCGMIHYLNPKIVTGCIVTSEQKILLCRRAISPRYGLWTIPAGFMELGETVQDAAARETWEEAYADAVIDELFGVYNIPRVSQVYVIFRAHLKTPEFSPGEESLETELFSEQDIPWDELAFKVVRVALEQYFTAVRESDMRPFVGDIIS